MVERVVVTDEQHLHSRMIVITMLSEDERSVLFTPHTPSYPTLTCTSGSLIVTMMLLEELPGLSMRYNCTLLASEIKVE